jgi:hypothetical protein
MTIHRRTSLFWRESSERCSLIRFAVPVLLNGDRYRPKTSSYLEESTGKKVEIGRLAVTFFPRVTRVWRRLSPSLPESGRSRPSQEGLFR